MLRNGDGQNLREYLIATAARLIGQRGSAGLAVREIAREAQVADGVLYNYFEDKEDLLAHALLAHVGAVMASAPRLLPPAGTGTVAENLRVFIDGGLAVLAQVTPAFAGLLSQPKVLSRFHAMVGGDAAFDPAAADAKEGEGEGGGKAATAEAAATAKEAVVTAEAAATAEAVAAEAAATATTAAGRPGGPHASQHDPGAPGLPAILTGYLRAEQRIGRIGADADVDAAATLIVGAIHGQILPRMLFSPPGSPASMPPGLAGRLAETVLRGIAPQSRQP